MAEVAVDVLIPVYNAARFVRSSVESIQKQSLSNICIHVVDDGSTDGSSAILAAMAAEDPRIRVYSRPNGGIVDALNAGLRHCRAEFLARHDADDLAYWSRLSDQVQFLTENPDVVAVAGRACHIDVEGRRLGTLAKFRDPEHADPAHVPALHPYLLHPFLMVRRAALDGVGGYRHVVHAEDADLYWRLMAFGRLVNQTLVQGEYRMHPDSISSQSIRTGRVMSVSSELCALSAMRRLAGREDLSFSQTEGNDLKAAAGSMEGACRSVDGRLTPAEALHLRFAAGVKLLELADYRPYEVESADCTFLAKALADSGSTVIGENRKSVIQSYAGTAARLAAARRWQDARLMINFEMLAPFCVMLLLRLLLPVRVHRTAQKISRNLTFMLGARRMARAAKSTPTEGLAP